MVRVEFEAPSARVVPLQVSAQRVVGVAVGGNGAGNREVLARTEVLGVEVRTGHRAIGPTTGGRAVVEPDPDAVGFRIDGVLRKGVVYGCGKLVGRAELQHRLTVDTLAVDIGEIVTGVLRRLVDIVRTWAVFHSAGRRQRTPARGIAAQITFAPARVELGERRLAALVRTAQQDAEGVVGKGLADDTRYLGCDFGIFERVVDNTFDADRTLEAGPIERTRGFHIDDRADAAGGKCRTPRLVDFDARNAFRGKVGEIE